MLPKLGGAKVFLLLLMAILIIQSKENKVTEEVDGVYDDDYKLYAYPNMNRVARFYSLYNKPSPLEDFLVDGNSLNKRRDRPRPMRFGK
uniref:Neuropeptide-Like Protein n=1 Tax=Strongyloides stercoralis TaxID=6248 RepID=A0A0K0EKA2_STRER